MKKLINNQFVTLPFTDTTEFRVEMDYIGNKNFSIIDVATHKKTGVSYALLEHMTQGEDWCCIVRLPANGQQVQWLISPNGRRRVFIPYGLVCETDTYDGLDIALVDLDIVKDPDELEFWEREEINDCLY